MTEKDKSTVLLEHYLKKLKLPTMLREYAQAALFPRQIAELVQNPLHPLPYLRAAPIQFSFQDAGPVLRISPNHFGHLRQHGRPSADNPVENITLQWFLYD